MNMHTRLDLYQEVTPLAGLGIFERNFLTGEIYWNPVIRSIYEVDSRYNPGFEDSLQFYTEQEKVRALMEAAIASGKAETAEFEIISAKNQRKKVRIRLQAAIEDGKCTRLYGTLEDITAYANMMSLLIEREKRFTQAFDFAPIGMALVSLTGGWIKVNMSLCTMLGYSEAEFLQHTFQDFTHPEDLDSDLEHLRELLDGRIQSYSMEKRYFHQKGHVIWVTLNVTLIRDESGQPQYFISQIRDITERKKSNETIRHQNSRLLNFAHIVSHNLRSHTGNLKMLTDMILEEENLQERNELIRMLNENSGNLLETLDHLNEVVKVHDGGQVGRISLDLKAAVLRVLDILAASVRQAGARIALDVPDALTVLFHPAYLESILINLVSNSLKYKHPDRDPDISIAAEIQERVILRVRDNGQGIDLATHGDKLFGMYKTFHRHPDARGMGLFLTKNQVEAMGGHIYAESQPDIGTTFTIEFDKVL